jgi:SAM-dependent methyltransferase
MADAAATDGQRAHQDRGERSFGTVAGAYDQGRPDYPLPAIDWLLHEVDGPVADVGAGTGKLSQVIRAAGHPVIAIDPDPDMLSRIDHAIDTRQGTGEKLPLPDASVAAVTFGQSWHWVDPIRATAEVVRVLRPGGVLGLLWNIRDESYDWVRKLGRNIHRRANYEQIVDDGPEVVAPFGEPEHNVISWTRPMAADDIVAMVSSRSYVIAAAPDVRDRVLAGVRELLVGHPDLIGKSVIEMPYTTHTFRYRRGPLPGSGV